MTSKSLRFTDEEVNKANNINIMEYATHKGLELTKVSRDSYHINGFGGLYINPISNKWNCFSQNKGGGPIQFCMFLQNNTWVEAVKELIDKKSGYLLNSERVYERPKNKKEARKEFILPDKNNTFKHIIGYLIKTRNIGKDIVYNLIKENKLYEDKKRNCVFVGYDKNNNPRYASLRSTNPNSTFKGEVKNSNKEYSFSIKGASNSLYIFESPIEIISYLSILKLNGISNFNHHMLLLGGLSDIALKRYLKYNIIIQDIFCCLNNDPPGIKGTKSIIATYGSEYNVAKEYPDKKDYNEDLINLIKIKSVVEEKNIMKTSSETYGMEEEFCIEL